MTEDEKFSALLTALSTSNNSGKELIDNLSKIGVAVCVMGIAWVGGQISSLDRKFVRLESNQTFIQSKVEKGLADPRFTAEMNAAADAKILSEILPLVQEVKNLAVSNRSVLLERKSFIDDTEDALDAYDDRVDELEDAIRDVHNMLKEK